MNFESNNYEKKIIDFEKEIELGKEDIDDFCPRSQSLNDQNRGVTKNCLEIIGLEQNSNNTILNKKIVFEEEEIVFFKEEESVFEKEQTKKIEQDKKNEGLSQSFKKIINENIKELKKIEGTVEKLEILGKIAHVMIKQASQEKIGEHGLLEIGQDLGKKNVRMVFALLEKSLKQGGKDKNYLYFLKVAEPYVRALKIVIDMAEYAKLREAIENCHVERAKIAKKLMDTQNNLSAQEKLFLKEQLLKIDLIIQRFEGQSREIALSEEGIVVESMELVLNRLAPILPHGSHELEELEWGVGKLSSFVNVLSSSAKIYHQFATIQTLLNLKKILRLKVDELKKGPSSPQQLRAVQNKMKELMKIEEKIFNERIDAQKEGLVLIKSALKGIEEVLPFDIAGVQHLYLALGALGEIPNFHKKENKVLNGFRKIQDLKNKTDQLSRVINKVEMEIKLLKSEGAQDNEDKIQAKKTLIAYLKLKQASIRDIHISKEIMHLMENLLMLGSAGQELGSEALLLHGTKLFMDNAALSLSLGLNAARYLLKGFKFMLFDRAILSSTHGKMKLHFEKKSFANKFQQLTMSIESLSKDIFDYTFDKLNKEPIKKLDILNKISEKQKMLGNQINKIIDKSLLISRQFALMPSESLAQEIAQLKEECDIVSNQLCALKILRSDIEKLKEKLTIEDHKNLAKMKIAFMNRVVAEQMKKLSEGRNELDLKATQIDKEYALQKKLDLLGLDLEDYVGLKNDLAVCLRHRAVWREFLFFFKGEKKGTEQEFLDPTLKEEKKAERLIDSLFIENGEWIK